MDTPKNLVVDHINGDGLNNQKSNLRNCTRRENSKNVNKRSGKSKYKGVSILSVHPKGRIVAQIMVDGVKKHIGVFKTEIEAAKAYDKYAKRYYGEFANLNFP